jgi:hypothetical protein
MGKLSISKNLQVYEEVMKKEVMIILKMIDEEIITVAEALTLIEALKSHSLMEDDAMALTFEFPGFCLVIS